MPHRSPWDLLVSNVALHTVQVLNSMSGTTTQCAISSRSKEQRVTITFANPLLPVISMEVVSFGEFVPEALRFERSS